MPVMIVGKPSVFFHTLQDIRESTLERNVLSIATVEKHTCGYILGRNLTSVISVGELLAWAVILMCTRKCMLERNRVLAMTVGKPSGITRALKNT